MKKGIICAVLALMVVLSMAGVAAAEETATPGSGDGNQSTTVTYTVTGTYTWVIPEAMVFEGNTLSFEKDVVIKDMIIAVGQKVVITVPGTVADKTLNCKLLLQNAAGTAAETDAATDEQKQIAYTIVGTTDLTSASDTTTVLSADAGDAEAITSTGKTNKLTVATSTDAIAAAKYAGTYMDTITFSAATETA